MTCGKKYDKRRRLLSGESGLYSPFCSYECGRNSRHPDAGELRAGVIDSISTESD